MTVPGTFAACYDERTPPEPGPLAGVVGPGASTLRHGPLALAWSGTCAAHEADDGTLTFLDGVVYDVDGLDTGPVAVRGLHDLLRRHGEDLLPKLRGDFVVVHHDPEARVLLVACDQAGGRGAVYTEASPLRFGSDERYVLDLLPSRPPPDPYSMAHWLSRSGPPDGRTMHEGLSRLPRASALRVERGARRRSRYWQLEYRGARRIDRETAAGELRDALLRAVERRTKGPMTTGLQLSGGLDSSSVAAITRLLDGDRRPQRAYSVTFPTISHADESSWIDATCAELGLRNTRVEVERGSAVAGAVEFVERWAVPPTSPNMFFWFPLLRAAADHGITELLDGEGGDELFGASPFLIADRLARGRIRSAVDLVHRIPGGRADLPRSTVLAWIKTYGLKGLVPLRLHHLERRRKGAASYVESWVRPQVARDHLDSDIASTWKRFGGPRWWAFIAEAVTQGAGSSLCFEHVRRRAAMWGIASRHPIVDVDVIELALGWDPELNFEPAHSRPVLRRAVEGLLPDVVRLRASKTSFNAPFEEALSGPDLVVARELLRPGEALVEQYVDLAEVERILLHPPEPSAAAWHALHLWRILTAEVWLRLESGPEGLPASVREKLIAPVLRVT